MSEGAEELVRGAVAVGSPPAVYQRLTEVIDHPHSTAADIAKIVGEDPGLTARLLGLVNSSFMGFPHKIETVSQAVTVVGTQQLSDLALATSVIHMFDDMPRNLVDVQSFWRHGLATGVFARVLACHRHEGNAERFFVAGLLHDIGSMVLYLRSPNQARRCLKHCEKTGALLHETERRLLGYDHADVGRALLRSWNLPVSHQDAVGSHHRPSQAFCFPTEAAVVHVSDIMAHALGDVLDTGTSGEQLVPALEPQAWDKVGLPSSQVPGIIDEAVHQFEEVERTMLWDEPS